MSAYLFLYTTLFRSLFLRHRQTGNRPLVEIQLHSRDGSAPLRACWDSRHAQLLVVSLRAQVTATPAPYPQRPKVKCLLITKRERWVAFLHKKMEHTSARVFSECNKRDMRQVKQTQAEVRERIAVTITTPNKSWAKRKKQEKYAIPRNYFGQYA